MKLVRTISDIIIFKITVGLFNAIDYEKSCTRTGIKI